AQPDQGGDGENEDRMSVAHELGYPNQAEDPKRKLMVVMIVSLFRAGSLVDADRDDDALSAERDCLGEHEPNARRQQPVQFLHAVLLRPQERA
ncbi:MAG: hypothetical protein ACRDFR_01080, partial [Candidatus Limnocylindria bacterium]